MRARLLAIRKKKIQLPADHEIFDHAIRNSGSWVDGGIIGVNKGWSVIRFHANATELVFEAWCCTSNFCPCCTDLNQLVWGNPVGKHRGASLDGISGFYFVAPHACLLLYFVILLRQSILILEFFCLPSVSHWHSYADPQRSVLPHTNTTLLTSSFDNKQVSMIWPSMPEPFLIPFSISSGLLFFLLFRRQCLAKAQSRMFSLEQRITVPESWHWKMAERPPHTDTVQPNYTATKSRLSGRNHGRGWSQVLSQLSS